MAPMKQDLIVFDLDDTLSIVGDRANILDQEFPTAGEKWDAFFGACDQDAPNEPIIAILRDMAMESKYRIEIWTGRTDKYRVKTEAWLLEHVTFPPAYNGPPLNIPLRMRASDDFRHDLEVKGEWVEKYGKPWLVFDDRNSMVKHWRSLGIVCCQVKENDF